MNVIKIVLGICENTNEKYTLISGKFGSAGTPHNHINNFCEIVSGGGIKAVSYFLSLDFISQKMKDKVIKCANENSFIY
jgi:hypothetical protein